MIKYKLIITLVISLFAMMTVSQNVAAFDWDYEVRTINGVANNVKHTHYGSAEIPLIRYAPVDYADKMSEPAGANRLSAREISNIISAQTGSYPNEKNLTDMFWQWGQFLDHDIDLTPSTSEAYMIGVPWGDPYFDPYETGTELIPLFRSIYVGGKSKHDPRQQINLITSYIDGSNVYGSDQARADALRTFIGGKLKTSGGGLYLPYNLGGYGNAGGPSPDLHLAGDVRANEQIALTAMHTLFVREHNRLADKIVEKYPSASDEAIYQIARKIVGAHIQAITYNEFLPLLLGHKALGCYKGYKKRDDPSISNEFSTAAYRFGHSMLSPLLLRLDEHGNETVHVPLKYGFFNPALVPLDGGIESLLRGLATQRAQEIDNKVVDDVRNFLFGPPGSGGFDLVALNIQRGRDHGLAHYNKVRQHMHLNKVRRFKQITSNKEVRKQLKLAYNHVDDMDLWVAGLAEDHVRDAVVGITFHKILTKQFKRLRNGDRFWYQNDPFFKKHRKLLKKIEKTTLADMIRRNTLIGDELQDHVFIVPGAHVKHKRAQCRYRRF